MLFGFVIMDCSGPENKIRHIFKDICKIIGCWLLWRKLLPGRLKTKWKQKQDRKSTKGLRGAWELPGLSLLVELSGPEGELIPSHRDRLVFLDKFSIDQWSSLVQTVFWGSGLPSQFRIPRKSFPQTKDSWCLRNQRLTNRLFEKQKAPAYKGIITIIIFLFKDTFTFVWAILYFKISPWVNIRHFKTDCN